MSDSFEITQEVLSTRNNFVSAPFEPSIQVVGDVGEIIFNQAYVFDYLGYVTDPIIIYGMDRAYNLGEQDYFYVEITFDTGTGGVTSASFRQKADILPSDTPLFIQTTDQRIQDSDKVNIPIADIENFKIKELYLRDNIQWWGRLIKQNSSLNTNVAHPIAEPDVLTNQPLIIKSISGNGSPDYKIVDVFDSTDSSGEDVIIVSGVTGYGVMYGDGPEGFETYKFLPYPTDIYIELGWNDILEAATPFQNPAWTRRQYLPQAAEGAAEGDMLYWDASALDGDGNADGAWVLLPAPDTSLYTGDPVLHHDGDTPYWGQDDIGSGNLTTTTGLYVCVEGVPTLVNFVIEP